MIGSFRLSRFAYPRATLLGLGMLTVVFITFGFFADAAVSNTYCEVAVLDLLNMADNLGEFDG